MARAGPPAAPAAAPRGGHGHRRVPAPRRLRDRDRTAVGEAEGGVATTAAVHGDGHREPCTVGPHAAERHGSVPRSGRPGRPRRRPAGPRRRPRGVAFAGPVAGPGAPVRRGAAPAGPLDRLVRGVHEPPGRVGLQLGVPARADQASGDGRQAHPFRQRQPCRPAPRRHGRRRGPGGLRLDLPGPGRRSARTAAGSDHRGRRTPPGHRPFGRHLRRGGVRGTPSGGTLRAAQGTATNRRPRSAWTCRRSAEPAPGTDTRRADRLRPDDEGAGHPGRPHAARRAGLSPRPPPAAARCC